MTWDYRHVRVTQQVSIVVGSSTNLFDTMRIEYTLENQDSVSHDVGLRIMLDTLIGDNDGVPFSVPGRPGITNRAVDLRGRDVPNFFQVLEKPDLANPGVIVNLTMSGGGATPPERVVITAWPGSGGDWEFLGSLGASWGPDSAVGLYYPTQSMRPGERRQIVAFYGLGAISSVVNKNPNLGLSISSTRIDQGSSFYVMATINNPQNGQRIRLQLPPELVLAEGDLSQAIAPEASANFTTRSWLVRAITPTSGAEISIVLEPQNLNERQTVTIVRLPTPAPTETLMPTTTPTPTSSGGLTR